MKSTDSLWCPLQRTGLIVPQDQIMVWAHTCLPTLSKDTSHCMLPVEAATTPTGRQPESMWNQTHPTYFLLANQRIKMKSEK